MMDRSLRVRVRDGSRMAKLRAVDGSRQPGAGTADANNHYGKVLKVWEESKSFKVSSYSSRDV